MDFSLKLGQGVLRQTSVALQAMLSDLSDDWITGDEGPDTWFPFQVVGHLTDIEECDWIDRTRVILEHGTEDVFQPVAERRGSPASGAGEVTLGQLLQRGWCTI